MATTLLTREQCRAARGLLAWTMADLEARAGVSESTVRDFEAGRRMPRLGNLEAVVACFRAHGVELISDGQASCGGGAGVLWSR
jgi:transcriptional regulator with XRE-family HTH domain